MDDEGNAAGPQRNVVGGGEEPRLPIGRRLALIATVAALCFAVLETGLRARTPFPIDAPSANTVPDPRIGHRMSSALPDIDERGYRNPPGIETATVVALGDSHTYGYNVDAGNTWPAGLAQHIGAPVYNLGIGGFGVLQYHDQLPEALTLQPEHVLIALYLANDVTSICGYVRIPHWKAALDGTADGRRFEAACSTLTRPDGQPLEAPPPASDAQAPAWRSAVASALRHLIWLPLRSELWIRGVIHRSDESRIPIDDPRNGTLVARNRLVYHARYMDYNDPHPAALAAFARERLLDMRRQAEAAGAAFAVMLVPTRERVLYPYLVDRGFDLPAEWTRLFEVETAATRHFLEFFAAEAIDAVDLAPAVAQALEGGSVYPRREDGHPLEAGYAAYARGAAEAFFAEASDTATSPR